MTLEEAIDDLLKIGVSASDIIPGLSQLKPDLVFALGASPTVMAAYRYFQSPKGQEAVREVNNFLAYVQSPNGQEAIAHVKAVLAVANTRT